MIQRLTKICHITVQELFEAARRIEEQTHGAIELRLWIRRRRRGCRHIVRKVASAMPLWRPCDLEPVQSATGNVYWLCRRDGCDNVQLRVMTRRQQWLAGVRCKQP